MLKYIHNILQQTEITKTVSKVLFLIHNYDTVAVKGQKEHLEEQQQTRHLIRKKKKQSNWANPVRGQGIV